MATPFFSIIVPVLNEKLVLPLLLQDLEQQSFTGFEVLVVDGNSTDGTTGIVKKMNKTDRRIQLVPTKKRNVGYQRNLGASKGKGKYLVFFDADTRIPVHFLAGVHYHCVKDNLQSFTCHAVPDTDNTKDKTFLKVVNLVFDMGAMMGSPFTFGACIGCRKDIFEACNGFDPTLTFYEDSEFVKRVVAHGYAFSVLKDPTYVYSLRRFRKEGTVRIYRSLAPIYLKQLLNEKITEPIAGYPMLGGSYFEQAHMDKKKITTTRQLQNLTQVIKSFLK